MSRHFAFGLAVLIAFHATAAFASTKVKIDPNLVSFGRGQTEAAYTKVIGVLEAPKVEDDQDRPPRYERAAVVAYLKKVVKNSFTPVAQYMKQQELFKKDVKALKLNFINNSFTAMVSPEGLRALSNAPGLRKIYDAKRRVSRVPDRKRPPILTEEAISSYGLKEIGLDELLAEAPESDGRGVILGVVDTGADGTHPALKGRIARYYDGEKHAVGEPVDYDTHGTHVSGTIAGGDRSSLRIGVAPGAKLVVAGVITASFDEMINGMQFMLDPDGDPATADAPRAVNNSWHASDAPDIELFYRAISAWEAAGILPVFAAGNSGPSPATILKPQVHPSVLAVGATGPNGKVTSFSSRGPADYKNQTVEKPDLTAPGESIPSSVPGGQYAKYDGTSMACPHVVGSVGLLLQAFPQFTPAQIKALFLKTASPMAESDQLGEPKWNAVYGHGKLNIYRAIKAAKAMLGAEQGLAAGEPDLGNSLLTSPQALDASEFFAQAPAISSADLGFDTDYGEGHWATGEDLQRHVRRHHQ